MKRNLKELEVMLRREEAPLPKGLRARTLQHMGLRLGSAHGVWRPWALATGMAAVLALSVVLLRPTQVPPIQEIALSAAKNTEQTLAQVPARTPIAETKSAPKAPLPSKQPWSAQASAPADLAPANAYPEEAAALDKSPLYGTGQPLTHRETTAPVFGKVTDSEPAESLSTAGGQTTRSAPPPYRLTVKGNRLRPSQGERLKVELQVTQYGRVRVGIYDSHGRLTRMLTDVTDPQGTLVLEWDGSLADGQGAPSGAYTLLVQSPDKTEKFGVLIIR